jgi:hypothetical protein
VLEAPTCLPFRNHVCGMEARPFAPVRATGAGAPGKPATSMACSAMQAEGALRYSREVFMADLYICNCGNQTWEIFDTGVRCTACKTEYIVQHAPVAEFNHMVAQEMEEELAE